MNLDRVHLGNLSLREIEKRLINLKIRRIRDIEKYPRHAAVLITLIRHKNEVSILFMKRSDGVKSHKGQVSFPGGMREKNDLDYIDTACREFEEETGISRKRLIVLGLFHQALAMTKVPVQPVIAFLDSPENIDDFVFDRREVHSLFVLNWQDLHERKLECLGMRHAPVFTAGPYKIWGLTAYILNDFLREICGFPVLK